MNLEPLRALHSHYLDILATVVTKIHTTQSTKKLSDIFSLTPLIKKLSTLLQLQVTQYGVEQVPDEDCLQSIAMNAQANVEKEHLLWELRVRLRRECMKSQIKERMKSQIKENNRRPT